MLRIVGVDPGLVHTGVVTFVFRPEDRTFTHFEDVVSGLDVGRVEEIVTLDHPAAVFIEAYRPRSHYDNDARMGAAVNDLKRVLPNATALDNTGVKQVVSRELMELLGVWKFRTSTNHQDLRSAARIAIYGMLKDTEWNALLAQIVIDALDGNHWN